MQGYTNSGNANTSVHPDYNYYKNKGATSDLKVVIDCVVSAS